MESVRTRGHEAAVRAIGAMIRGRTPHALLLVGAAGVGKTTLATDLAAGLLCAAADPAQRPCGSCRACRLVRSGGHADVHRLGPEGPGRQVVIGGPGARARGIRDLIAELALLPVEGGARVAIIESAQRMNEDAQAALLKTLEEPPTGTVIILCADAEEPLLPTIRSRCARLRLGPVGPRAIEAVLADHGIDDPALATRLARIAGGRPGVALAWAADPAVMRARDECSRVLLDLTAARPSDRLAGVRAAVAAVAAFAAASDASAAAAPVTAGPPAPTTRGRRGSKTRAMAAPDTAPDAGATDPGTTDAGAATGGDDADGTSPTRAPAAERRRAADAIVAIWTDVARDLALARRGESASLRDPRLLEEVVAIADELDQAAITAFLDRLGRAGVLLAGNVAPELVLDDLALAWPQRRPAAA
jgi:DNA polymerase III delta' subunit